MVNTPDSDVDEDALLEAAWEHSAATRPRDVLTAERERQMKGHRPNVALEKWGPEIEEMMMQDLQARKTAKPRGQVLQMVRPKTKPTK
jgi:hypothetical protein